MLALHATFADAQVRALSINNLSEDGSPLRWRILMKLTQIYKENE